MNINEMNDQEKSVMIFNLIGWKTEAPTIDSQGLPHVYATNLDTGEWLRVCKGNTLYEAKNMALAWRVLNWAAEYLDIYDKFLDVAALETEKPEVAQAIWLDKSLELAIEAGIVKR